MRACNHDVHDNEDGTLTIVGDCPATGKEWTLVVNAMAYDTWVAGELLIQDAFPDFTPAQREMLMTGYTDEGWKLMFGSPEDDEDEICPRCDGEGEEPGAPDPDAICSVCRGAGIVTPEEKATYLENL